MTDKLQYYYKDNACPAEHSRAETCICWHDEGKGPFPDLKNGDDIPMAYGSAIGLTWRAAPQPAPVDREACRAKQAEPDRGSDETPYDRGYVWGYRHGLRDGKAEVAPQPALADREALVEVIDAHVFNALGETLAEAIADALLARGPRLPGGETMAWAVVGKDGKIDPRKLWINSRDAEEYCERGERAVRVAIRVVEGGDDAA